MTDRGSFFSDNEGRTSAAVYWGVQNMGSEDYRGAYMTASPRALIIGGSLGGLSTAIAPRRIGWDVEVF